MRLAACSSFSKASRSSAVPIISTRCFSRAALSRSLAAARSASALALTSETSCSAVPKRARSLRCTVSARVMRLSSSQSPFQ